MRYLILGGAGFIATNLTLELSKRKQQITLVDRDKNFFNDVVLDEANIIIDKLDSKTDFITLTKDIDIVFHLVSFAKSVSESIDSQKEIDESINFTAKLLKACEINNVKKVLFVSSGGTVYGKSTNYPIKESESLAPISAYGLEKTFDEACFNNYESEYHIFRLANPYGPYQRPEGAVGAVTKFLYMIRNNMPITITGDGSIVRDFIYIDDAVKAMLNIAESTSSTRIYNIGSGIGTSLNELIEIIKEETGIEPIVKYSEGRAADVPINYLDVSLYEKEFGKLATTSLKDGIKKMIAE